MHDSEWSVPRVRRTRQCCIMSLLHLLLDATSHTEAPPVCSRQPHVPLCAFSHLSCCCSSHASKLGEVPAHNKHAHNKTGGTTRCQHEMWQPSLCIVHAELTLQVPNPGAASSLLTLSSLTQTQTWTHSSLFPLSLSDTISHLTNQPEYHLILLHTSPLSLSHNHSLTHTLTHPPTLSSHTISHLKNAW